jgi:acetyltransferase-like isoleucine patch superfamily enzyme
MFFGWQKFWMQFAGLTSVGRIAARLASLGAPPFYARLYLSRWGKYGYVSPDAVIHHSDLHLSPGDYIDDKVLIFQDRNGGPVHLGSNVHLWRGTILQTGETGSITIGNNTHVQPRCQFSAYKGSIEIGQSCEIAPFCCFYPYDHGIAVDIPLNLQPLKSKGPIVIEDEAWLGVRVTVLAGVRIGRGAVIGAGSIVTRDIPAGAVAAGVPARVVKMRGEATSGAF